MNPELEKEFLNRIESATDPFVKAKLMDDFAFARQLALPPDFMTQGVVPQGDTLQTPAVPVAPGMTGTPRADVLGFTPTSVAAPVAPGPTVGDLRNGGDPQKPLTVADFLKAQGQAAVASTVAAQPATPNIPYVFAPQPVFDNNVKTFGQTAQQLTSQALLQRQDLVNQIEQERLQALETARRYKTGEERVAASGLTNMLEIARSPEDFARIKAAGKIPIAARDAQVIIENAQREANAILRAGEEGVAIAAADRRQVAGRQVGAGIGHGLAAALTGINTGTAELGAIRQQAEAARQNLLKNLDNRRMSQVDAEKLNSKEKIDAMIAEMEPKEAISRLIQADTMDQIQRQFQAEKEAQAKADAATLRLEQIAMSEPEFKASLLNFGRNAMVPIPGQFIEPNATRSSGQDPLIINQQLDAAITNAAKKLDAQLKVIAGTPDIFVNEGDTDAAINEVMADTQQLIEYFNNARRNVMIAPEVAAKMDHLINLSTATLEGARQGRSSLASDETGELDNLYKQPQSTLRQSLDSIINTPIFGQSNVSATATGGTKKLDFAPLTGK